MGNVGSRHQWVYRFNEFKSLRTLMANEGQLPLNLLGGKGLGLAEMTELGLPVPPGLIITTEACSRYFEAGGNLQSEIWHQVLEALKKLEVETEKKLGDPKNPLLVSCRSGARASMPGMMNSILNIGLNQQVVDGMLHDKGDESFVYDLYRLLIQMFACVVKNVDDEPFEDILSENRKQAGIKSDAEFSGDQWKKICDQFENTYRKETGQGFPQDPLDKIYSATKAVFESWNGRRAVDYCNATGIPHDWGTAVNIVTMVFGNRDSNSATGVCFSRNPDTGENGLYGDFLINAQGEDVVAGIRNTIPVVKLAEHFPDLYHDFKHTVGILETHYRDMQDVEFTIEQGKLWILQTRSGKRTARAAIKIAVDLVNEGIISPKEALMRVSPEEVDAVLHNNFDEKAKAASLASGNLIATGVNASPGAAVGAAALSAETAEKWGKEGKAVIMVRPFTKPDDINGMLASKGILTAEGGATSHAAVVARQFGVPCIVGANTIKIDLKKKQIHGNGLCVNEGDTLSIDGSSGECFIGSIATRKASFEKQKDLNEMLRWADQEKRLRVLANADQQMDGAILESQVGSIVMSTDSHVVSPIFFPGGDIGSLAVFGTANDVAMCGARPLYLSVGFILEEGFSMESLWRITQSIKNASDLIGVKIVTGDTKVVDKGKGDGIYINTTGVGFRNSKLNIGPNCIEADSTVIISGDIGRHGIAVMASREGLEFETDLISDCGPLSPIVDRLLASGITIQCMRDLTRGGLATAILEICDQAGIEVVLEETSIPVNQAVKGACEMLGLDPHYVANEGCFSAFLPSNQVDQALKIIREFPQGKDAAAIGQVVSIQKPRLSMKTEIGTHRIMTMLSGEQLPRIC